MDFLDPLKRRQHRRRLIISYILMGLAIAAGTVLLVLAANGYGINTKTGDIVQNGLVFIDSHPGGADISLNGIDHSKTGARLVLPTQTYNLILSRDGYQSWHRTFRLAEQTIIRLDYPLLFPAKPTAKEIKRYPSLPGMITSSPDRRWLVVGDRTDVNGQATLEVYDTQDPSKPSQKLSLASGLLSKPGKRGGQLSAIQWAADGVHLLLKHSYQKASEYLILDRNQPSRSVNINKLFKLAPSEVSLRDNKADQLYIYQAKAGSLQVGLTSQPALAKPFLRHILSYKAVGPNQIIYVSNNPTKSDNLDIHIWDNGSNYLLANLPKSGRQLIDATKFLGSWYYAVGSSASPWLSIYKNPLDVLKKPSPGKLDALVTLKIAGASNVSFSPKARFIAAEGGQNFAVHDFDTGNDYRYKLKTPLGSSLHWMDDYRLIGASRGQVFVADYDGINGLALLPTSLSQGGFVSSDYRQLFTIAPASHHSQVLESINLRAGDDL